MIQSLQSKALSILHLEPKDNYIFKPYLKTVLFDQEFTAKLVLKKKLNLRL